MDNCKISTNGNCVTIQPISKANYFDYNFETEYNQSQNRYIAVIGSKYVLDAYNETLHAPSIKKGLKEDLQDFQLLTKDHIFCGLKFQVDDMELFNKKPKIIYLEGDQLKEKEINFANYLTEFAFKNNILTVPLRFLADNRFVMYWELPVPADAQSTNTAVITLEIEKVLNQVYSI